MTICEQVRFFRVGFDATFGGLNLNLDEICLSLGWGCVIGFGLVSVSLCVRRFVIKILNLFDVLVRELELRH